MKSPVVCVDPLALKDKKMSKKKLIFWIPIFFLLAWMGAQYRPVTIHIRGSTPEKDFSIRMPLKDKKRLEYFFRDVCFLHEWAYTLMGSKPVSVHQYTKPWAAFQYAIKNLNVKNTLVQCFWPPDIYKISYHLNPEQLKGQLGAATLNKYMHYFPDSKFVLYTGCHENTLMTLMLVDKIKVIKTVKQHLEDFQPTLKKHGLEPEDLIDKDKLYAFLKYDPDDRNPDLFGGTLFGYGRDNAWLFSKYREMNSEEWPLTTPWPEEEFVNLEHLNQRTLSFQPWDLSDLFYPRFACDPLSEETRRLKQTYREEREKIIEYYQDKDVVEASLNLLNQP